MGEKRGMKALEMWCRRVVSGYRDVRLDNMTTAWRDGLAFCAVIHHFRPDLIDFDSLSKENIFHNNNLAFSVAEQCLGIPALLDPEDMVKYTVPDKLSIMTYTAQYYQFFHSMEAGLKKTPTKRSLDDKNDSIASLADSPGKRPAIAISSSTAASAPAPGTVIRRNDVCQACRNRVYILERLIVDNKLYHRTCFKCCKCQAVLNPGSYMEGREADQYECHQCPTESDRQSTANARRLGKSQLRPFSEFDASRPADKGANPKLSSPAAAVVQPPPRPLDIAMSASRARMEFCANGGATETADVSLPPVTDTGQVAPPSLSVAARGDTVVDPVEQKEQAPPPKDNGHAPPPAQLEITIAPPQSSLLHHGQRNGEAPSRIIGLTTERSTSDHDPNNLVTVVQAPPITSSDVRNNNVTDSLGNTKPPLPVFATYPSKPVDHETRPLPLSIYDAETASTTPPRSASPHPANTREPTTNNRQKSATESTTKNVDAIAATHPHDQDGNISSDQSSLGSVSKPVPPQRPSSLKLTTTTATENSNKDRVSSSLLAVVPIPSARKRSTHKEPQDVPPPSSHATEPRSQHPQSIDTIVGDHVANNDDDTVVVAGGTMIPMPIDSCAMSDTNILESKPDAVVVPQVQAEFKLDVSVKLEVQPDVSAEPEVRSDVIAAASVKPENAVKQEVKQNVDTEPEIMPNASVTIKPEIIMHEPTLVGPPIPVVSVAEVTVADEPEDAGEAGAPVTLRHHSATSTPERAIPVAAPRMRKSKMPEKSEHHPAFSETEAPGVNDLKAVDTPPTDQLASPPPKPPRHSPVPHTKSARYRPPVAATNIEIATPPPKIDYPDDLNPFGDDEEDAGIADASPLPSSANRVQVAAKVSATPKPPSQNPFGDTDDEEDEPAEAKSVAVTPASAGSATSRRVIHCDIQSLNPFLSDSDEEEEDDDGRGQASSYSIRSAPVPAQRGPPLPASRPSLDAARFAADETRSLDGSATLRKKRPAPRPPATLHHDSTSPSPSPRSARKSSAAPPPPSTSSPHPRQRHTINPASFRRAPNAASTAATSADDESHLLTEKSLKELDNLNLTRGVPVGVTPRPSPERLPAPRPPLPYQSSRSQADLSTISSDVPLSPDSLESHASMQSLSSPSAGSGRGTTFGQWKKKKLAPPVPVPLRRQIEKLPIKEIHVELEEIEEKQCELEKVGVEIEKAIRGNFSDDVEPSVEEEDLILQLFELVNKKNVLFRRQAELTYLKRQHRLEEEHADLEFRIRIMMEKPYSKKTEADISVEEQLIARLVEVVTQRNEIIESMELDRLREAQEDQSIQERLALHRGQRRGSFSSQGSSTSVTPAALSKKSKKKEKKKKHKTKDEDKDTDETEATTAAKSGGKTKEKKRLWF